jgi:NAD(P)H-nitrite reductase large subunit
MGLHSLKDLGQLKAKIKPEERIAIVGAGLVGLELAFDLHHVGCQIELFDLGASPMSRAFPEAVGLHLKEKCSSMGMNVHMGNTILELNELEEAITCKMANGDDVIVDQIISVVGMKANSDLAKSTGMECDIGIKVDESGATSIPYIYAVGDCAQLGSQPKYFVAPLNRGAQRLVSSLLGKNEAPKEPALEAVKMKTDPYPIAFALPDVTPSGATWDVVEDDQGLKATLKSVTGDVLGYISAGKSFSMDIPIESSHLQKTEVVV